MTLKLPRDRQNSAALPVANAAGLPSSPEVGDLIYITASTDFTSGGVTYKAGALYIRTSTGWSEKAEKGDTGAAGTNGTDGTDGTDGVDGTDGAKGDPGVIVVSAASELPASPATDTLVLVDTTFTHNSVTFTAGHFYKYSGTAWAQETLAGTGGAGVTVVSQVSELPSSPSTGDLMWVSHGFTDTTPDPDVSYISDTLYLWNGSAWVDMDLDTGARIHFANDLTTLGALTQASGVRVGDFLFIDAATTFSRNTAPGAPTPSLVYYRPGAVYRRHSNGLYDWTRITLQADHVNETTPLPAANLTGTIVLARLPNLPASQTNSGTFALARIPALPASQTTSGQFATARVASGTATAGNLPVVDASGDLALQSPSASLITSGQFATARVAGGTATEGHIPTADSSGNLQMAAPAPTIQNPFEWEQIMSTAFTPSAANVDYTINLDSGKRLDDYGFLRFVFGGNVEYYVGFRGRQAFYATGVFPKQSRTLAAFRVGTAFIGVVNAAGTQFSNRFKWNSATSITYQTNTTDTDLSTYGVTAIYGMPMFRWDVLSSATGNAQGASVTLATGKTFTGYDKILSSIGGRTWGADERETAEKNVLAGYFAANDLLAGVTIHSNTASMQATSTTQFTPRGQISNSIRAMYGPIYGLTNINPLCLAASPFTFGTA